MPEMSEAARHFTEKDYPPLLPGIPRHWAAEQIARYGETSPWVRKTLWGLDPLPINHDVMLTRQQLADALTTAGFPVSSSTLKTKASRGDSPPYKRFGRVALYQWGEALQWAQSRMLPPQKGN